MKTLLAAITVAALSVGQPASGSIAGTWTAAFEGRTFIRLELKTVNGATTGGISLGDFAVDSEGEVNRADAARAALNPIYDVTLMGSTLTFFMKDGDDPNQFELRLLDNGVAELRILLSKEDLEEFADNGVTVPRPIRVTKAG